MKMRIKRITLFYFTALVLFSASCTSEKIESPESLNMLDYFPLQESRVLRYNVEDIILNTLEQDTLNYFLEDQFLSVQEEGEREDQQVTALISSTSTGESISDPNINKIYTVTLTNNSLIRNEDDLRFIDLETPIVLGSIHNEFFFQANEEQLLEVVSIGEDYILPDTTFENCVVLSAEETNNAIFQYQYERVYQFGVGLVYFKLINTSQQPQEPRLGRLFEQQLITSN